MLNSATYNKVMRGLKPFLIYKIIEQVETQQGWLDDGAANRLAVSKAQSPDQWLLIRAQTLSDQAHFTATLNTIRATAVGANLMMWGICAVIGFLAGLSVLGSANTPVNVLWVVLSLLGVPSLTLLMWVFAMLFSNRSSEFGGLVGRVVQNMLKRFTRDPNSPLFWQAWHQTTSPSGAQRWLFSMLTHGFWLLALSFSVLSMAIAFSVKHYVFLWETTWFDPQSFVRVASFLGAIPAQFSLALPDSSLIAQSGNTAIDSWEARALWARWLIAVILVWGVVPRLFFFILSAIRWHQTTAYLKPKTTDAYALACLARLSRVKARLEPEGGSGLPDAWQAPAQPLNLTHSTLDAVVLGVELRALPDWATASRTDTSDIDTLNRLTSEESVHSAQNPQSPHSPHTTQTNRWVTLGIVDNLASRETTLQALAQRPPNKLLIICDALQTPDRGTLRLIDNLQKFAQQNHVFLMHAVEGTHTNSWRQSLNKLGLSIIHTSEQETAQWLNAHP